MKNIIFNNERTMANAGAGKTYALTSRFIALVLGGAKPEEICALTFTRKAAGEFFNKTITMLAEAASEPKKTKELASYIKEIAPGLGEPARADFEKTLEKIVKASPRLRLETIDAFTSGFVKFFAAELGVNESVTVLDDFSESKIKARALALAVQNSAGGENFSKFAEIIKEANNGSNEKKILSAIEKTREDAHEAFIETPEKSKWALPKTSGEIPCAKWDEKKYAENTAALEAELKNALARIKGPDLQKSQALSGILGFFKGSTPERPAKTGKIMDNIIANFSAEKKSNGGYKFYKMQIPIEGKAAELVDENLKMLFWGQVCAASAATKAVYEIISAYDKIYDEIARKRGLMSFSDMTMSVAKDENRVEKTLVDFRFDSAIKHWLFDEFQDTSRAQWKIFENLVSEAAQDTSGDHTFFYVGDAKQAIYGWRGGDVSLFDEILEKFKGNIVQTKKAESFRSCPAIIDTVNKVFGDFGAISKQYGAEVAKQWKNIWQEHLVSQKIKDDKISGEATIKILPKAENTGEKEAIAGAVYDYIKEKDPISKGATCAVLVQKNDFAEEIIETIRARAAKDNSNIRAAGELDIKIAQDNLAVPPMYAMLKAAAHPGDRRSLEFAKMSPLREIFEDDGWRGALISKISSAGFAQAMLRPAKILAGAAKGDAFTNLRISQFMEAARLFDEEQNRNIDDFLDFISAYKIREGAASDTIQVMTIHKAKGLDFDMVILPQLGAEGSHFRKMRRDKEKNVFVLPKKIFCDMDKNLEEACQYAENGERFESLCKFYVALTRAKHSLHIILPFVKSDTLEDTADKHNFAYLLRDTLPCADGQKTNCSPLNNPKWTKKSGGEKSEVKNGAPSKNPAQETAPAAYSIPEPDEIPRAEAEFSFDFLNRGTANLTGLAAHSIFENLDGKKSLSEAAAAAKILYAGCPENFAAALAEVEKSLENPQIKEVFERPDFLAELPYAIEENGEIQTGRIDRVNFFEGRKKAEIIDFKTDAATPAQLIDRHAEQLRRYARALSKMSGIPPENIELKILSTHNREIVEVKA